jgi:hypothetical protein
MTINMLPKAVLLQIFDFYLQGTYEWNRNWHKLVHVCRRWRSIIFRWPSRLNVYHYCTGRKLVRQKLDVWPPLVPIKLAVYGLGKPDHCVDNVIAALEHNNRVCEIDMASLTNTELENILEAMQKPFPALTRLDLSADQMSNGGKAQLIRVPDSFLGGSAPKLRTLSLYSIPVPFPGLQKLLWSAVDLNELYLSKIPHTVYFSPEAIVTCLSALPKLKTLHLTFKSPRSRPDRESRLTPHPTRATLVLLPVLTWLTFKGVSEYFEDLVAQIDAPLLDDLSITFFHQLTFNTPHLAQFISRAPRLAPSLRTHDEAHIVFEDHTVRFTLPLPSLTSSDAEIRLGITCRHQDLQLSSVKQVCASSLPLAFIPMVKHLRIEEDMGSLGWPRENDIQKSEWLGLLYQFTAVKSLYLTEKLVPRIVPALQELVKRRAVNSSVLPALQCLFLEGLHTSGPVQQAIRPFISAQELTSHPITVSYWDGEEDMHLDDYDY